MFNTRKAQHKQFIETTLAGYHVFYAKSRGQGEKMSNFFAALTRVRRPNAGVF
jgi:hypothetical protein